jgi:hypothetical protein
MGEKNNDESDSSSYKASTPEEAQLTRVRHEDRQFE